MTRRLLSSHDRKVFDRWAIAVGSVYLLAALGIWGLGAIGLLGSPGNDAAQTVASRSVPDARR
jgi:Tfp pilus assembly protein FimV